MGWPDVEPRATIMPPNLVELARQASEIKEAFARLGKDSQVEARRLAKETPLSLPDAIERVRMSPVAARSEF